MIGVIMLDREAIPAIANGATEAGLSFGAELHRWKTDASAEDDDYDRRPQRRRYEEPLYVKVRKQLLSLAESVSGSIDAASAGS